MAREDAGDVARGDEFCVDFFPIVAVVLTPTLALDTQPTGVVQENEDVVGVFLIS